MADEARCTPLHPENMDATCSDVTHVPIASPTAGFSTPSHSSTTCAGACCAQPHQPPWAGMADGGAGVGIAAAAQPTVPSATEATVAPCEEAVDEAV